MDDSELNALIKLLSDPDEFVSESVKKKLIDEFDHIQHKFSEAIADSENNLLVQRGNEIIREYHFIRAINELKKWKNSKSKDLIKGIVIISKIFSPELEYQEIYSFFESIRRNLTFDIKNLSPIEQIRFLNNILFKQYKFKVLLNVNNFENFLISESLKTKNFSPLIITVIYYLTAKRLDIPIVIVKNKEIILLSYLNKLDDNNKFEEKSKENYYFFVNPADKGYVFRFEELKYSIKEKNINSADDFTTTDHSDILKLIIGKLIMVARNKNLLEIMDYLVMLHKTLY